MTATIPTVPLTEDVVMNGFHIFLQNALAQAKAEKLIDDETLSSAEADLMVSGPALCLFFACLRSTSSPPSVPLPRSRNPSNFSSPIILNALNCPRSFRGLFALWAQCVPLVQVLPSDQQHDLARIVCGMEPISTSRSRHDSLRRLAADLRAVAIEISQRRTFQERYQEDLQVALDQATPGSPPRAPSPFRATFVPPPMYGEKPTSPSSGQSPQGNSLLSPTSPNGTLFASNPDLPPPPADTQRIPGTLTSSSRSRNSSRRSSPQPPTLPLRPVNRGHTRATSEQSHLLQPPSDLNSASGPSSATSSRVLPRPASPTILTPSDPAIIVIRETLYASLADVIARTPSIKRMLRDDPPRAYFSAVGSAILDFALHSLNEDGTVRAVLGATLRMEDLPANYQPIMAELGAISRRVRELEDEDNDRAIQLLQAGEDELPVPRMERVHRMLEKGVTRGWAEIEQEEASVRNEDYDDEDEDIGALTRAGQRSQRRRERGRSRSPSGTALQLTNRINTLALAMTRLPAFRERQTAVFKILAGVSK